MQRQDLDFGSLRFARVAEVAGREAHASTERRRYCRNAGQKILKTSMGESLSRAKPSYEALEDRIDGLLMSFDESVVTRC